VNEERITKEDQFTMTEGRSSTTNALLAVIAVLLLLIVLYAMGVIGPKKEAEFRIETPAGDAKVDID
jgi:hypothetical protein